MEKYKSQYEIQRRNAKCRNIGFHFTFEEWYNWWLSTGKLHLRGNTTDKPYMMCRIGDIGDYSIDNVYCGTHSDNVKDTYNGDRIGWNYDESTRSHISSLGGQKGGGLNKNTPEYWKSLYDQIAHVDFSKRGSVAIAQRILGCSHTQVRRILKHSI